MSRLDDIKARLAEATPGPWSWQNFTGSGGRLCPSVTGEGGYGVLSCDGEENAPNRADAALVVTAPADLAYLLGEVQKFRGVMAGVAKGIHKVAAEMGAAELHLLADALERVVAGEDPRDVSRESLAALAVDGPIGIPGPGSHGSDERPC